MMRSIRAFFFERGFTEVETPVRVATPCMEEHIDAEPSGTCFLRTSPEIHHKQLLAGGFKRIFEMGKCFRSGERGRLHHPEYTMLEWYRAATDYFGVLADTRALVERLADEIKRPHPEWRVCTVSDLFLDIAGWDPVEAYDADRFNLDLCKRIEPAILKMGGAVVLIDYPAEESALSRRKAVNPQVAERWELYLDGIETANAYSELTDPDEQRARFKAWGEKRKASARPVYALDESFLTAMAAMPPAGGAALGVDRLLMWLMGSDSLDAVLPFRSASS